MFPDHTGETQCEDRFRGDDMAIGEVLWFLEKWGNILDAQTILKVALEDIVDDFYKKTEVTTEPRDAVQYMSMISYMRMAIKGITDCQPVDPTHDMTLAAWLINEGVQSKEWQEQLPFLWRLAEYTAEYWEAFRDEDIKKMNDIPMINCKQVQGVVAVQHCLTSCKSAKYAIKEALIFQKTWEES